MATSAKFHSLGFPTLALEDMSYMWFTSVGASYKYMSGMGLPSASMDLVCC